MVATVDGYDVAYTHRGSWKAYRRHRGKVVDEIPVAWTRDYCFGNPPKLVVWFKDISEASERLAQGGTFVVALAKKKAGGASSNDISRLLEVGPLETVAPDPGTRSGLRCMVIGKCAPPGNT